MQSIPYKLGSSFDESNIDLEHKKIHKDSTELYLSDKHSEIYFFEKSFESVCYLWFKDEILIRSEYRIHNKYFTLFLNSVNAELQQGNKLTKDPFVNHRSYFTSLGNLAIGLDEITKDYFMLRYWLPKEFNTSVTIKK